jgi:alpha-L-rhamnosidase
MPRAEDLRCDYRESGAVLDDAEPVFGWAVSELAEGGEVAAFQVLVASEPSGLRPGRADCWDSGRVEGGSSEVRYAGRTLLPGKEYWWTVRLWAAREESPFAAPACFELALAAAEWSGPWLGLSGGRYGQALLLRRRFVLEGPDLVRRARAYVACAGWHQLRVNGGAADDRVLEPAQSVLSKRVICSAYRLEQLLRPGPNVVGLVLGGGWYGHPCVRVHLRLERTDGSMLELGAERGLGGRWEVAPAEILASSPYDGELVDSRLERPGWDEPGERVGGIEDGRLDGDDDPRWDLLFGAPGSRQRMWVSAQAVDGPVGAPAFPRLPPAAVCEEHGALAVSRLATGGWVADAGSNGAGWVRLRIPGARRGQRVELRYAETLHSDGSVNQENLRSARCIDSYICSGRPEEVFEPKFTCHGFRYVELHGLATAPATTDVIVRRVRTPGAERARLSCSRPLLERIWSLVVRTEASNTLGALTDCPQRDERQGWLNDLTDRLDSAVLVHDIGPLLAKVLDDIADSQAEDGSIPDTVPYRWGFPVADPVCLAPVLIPRVLLRHFGDDRVVERAYPVARNWVRYLESAASDDGVLSLTHYGDWSEPKEVPGPALAVTGGDGHARSADAGVLDAPASDAVSRRTPGALVSTACLFRGLVELSALACILGDGREADRALEDAERIRLGFRKAFRDPSSGTYGTGSQGSLACALGLGLVPEAEAEHVAGLLADDVRSRLCLTTGNVATKFLLEALTDFGHHDLALMLANRTEYPSWGYMVEHGATTLWERWEEATGGGMNSHNHGMLGAIGSWLVTRHAGLRVSEDARRSDRFVAVVPEVSGDERVVAELATPRGLAALAWERAGDHLTVTVTVPPGTTALLHAPVRPDRAQLSGAGLGRDGQAVTATLGGGRHVLSGPCC